MASSKEIKDKWAKVNTTATNTPVYAGDSGLSEDEEIRRRWLNNDSTANLGNRAVVQESAVRTAALNRLRAQQRPQMNEALGGERSGTGAFQQGLREGAVRRAMRDTAQLRKEQPYHGRTSITGSVFGDVQAMRFGRTGVTALPRERSKAQETARQAAVQQMTGSQDTGWAARKDGSETAKELQKEKRAAISAQERARANRPLNYQELNNLSAEQRKEYEETYARQHRDAPQQTVKVQTAEGKQDNVPMYLLKSAGTGAVSGFANVASNLIDNEQSARELAARFYETADSDNERDAARQQNAEYWENKVRPASEGGRGNWNELTEDEQAALAEKGPYSTKAMKDAARERDVIAGDEAMRSALGIEQGGRLAGEYQQEQGKTGALRVAGDVTSAVGGMAPNMLASAVGGSAAGFAALYSSAAGASAQEARDNGADTLTAGLAGALSGAVEIATEKMFDGIPWMHGEQIGSIQNAVDKGINRAFKTATGRRLANRAVDILGEGLEEYVSDFAGSYISQLYSEDDRTVGQRLADPDAWYSFLIGSLMSVAMSAPVDAVNDTAARRTGKEMQASSLTDAVLELAEQQGGEAAEMAGVLREQQTAGKTFTPTELGYLFNALDAKSQAEIVDRVVKQDTVSETEDGGAAATPSTEGEGLEGTGRGVEDAAPYNAELAENLSGEQQAENVQVEQFTAPLLEQVQQETAEMAGQDGGRTAVQQETGNDTLRKIAAQRNMVANGMTVDEAQQTYDAQQAVQRGAAEVRSIAESGVYNEAMQAALTENYHGGSVDTYVQAMNGLYNAGRTGSLTYEQGLRAAAPAAAVVGDEVALRAAYEAGRSESVLPVEAAGSGALQQGGVQYEGVGQEDSPLAPELLEKVAERLGVNIRVVEKVTNGSGEEVNGYWAAGMSEIAVGANSGNAYQTVLHEITHYLNTYNAPGWDALRNALLNFSAESSGMTEMQKIIDYNGRFYESDAAAADETARDILSGIMSTEDGAQQFCEYLADAKWCTAAEKKTILQTLRDTIRKIIDSIRTAIHGGNATPGAAEGRELAERAEKMGEAASIIDDFLDELDTARQNAQELGQKKNVQAEQKENAPADAQGGKRYSYAGTEAAQADFNDLHKAQQMELDGEDDETIRKETGWFRGSDHRWRFEIDDSKTVWHREGDYGLQLNDATYREYKDLMNKMLYGTLNAEQTARLQQLDKQYKGAAKKGYKELGDYLEAPELYKQYPNLQTLPVSFENLGSDVNGAMSRLDGLLLNEKLRGADADYLKRIALHEVQHWIQNEEGFAGGANPEYWAARLKQDTPIETKGVRDARGKMQALEERYPGIAEYAAEYGHYESDEQLETLLKRAERDGISEEALDDYYMAQWDAEQANNPDSRTPTRLYYDTAGEQEARDTAARAHYTAEERRATKPFTGNSDTVFADKQVDSYSIDKDTDGKEFAVVDEDILKDVARSQWPKAVMQTLKERYPNGFMRDGWHIELTRDGRKEFTSSRDMQRMAWEQPQMYADKLRMGANLDDVIAVGENLRSEELKHVRKDDIVSFNRSDVRVRVGANDYIAEVVTAIKPQTREIFYNIVNLKQTKIDVPTEMQSTKKTLLATDIGERASTIDNVPQSGEKVNKAAGAMTAEEAYAQSEQLKKAVNELRAERKAWENSTAVEEVRAERDEMRKRYGMFSAQIKEWEANTPAWQEYAQQRDQYKKQAIALREQQDAVDEVLRNAGADKAAKAWQEKQTAQQEYDRRMQESGMNAADYRRALAVKQYGTTDSYEAAGYLLPDGRMLDFTEGTAGEKRGVDHRNIQTVFGAAELGQNATQASYLNQFISEGNVRIMPESPGVDISAEVKPTAAQYERIAEMADTLGAQNRKFSIDLSDADGKQIASRQYEGRVRGSDVVNDLKAFYRDGALPERSEVEQFRYSKKQSAAEQVVSAATEKEQLQKQVAEKDAENRALARKYVKAKESADYWRQETQLSGGHLMDKTAVKKTAAEFVDKYGSRYSKSQLAGELERTFSKISKDGASTEEALETLTNLARGVLKESTVRDTTLRDYYAPVREWLKNATLEVRKGSPEYADLLAEYGDGADGKRSWGNVRKNTYGRLNLKLVGENMAGNLDTAMMEMADNWPTIFDADAAPADNVRSALAVFEASKAEYHDTYGNDLDTAAALAGQELMDAYLNTPTRQTRADKAAAALKETRRTLLAEQKAALRAQKAAYEARIKTLESDQSARKAKLRAKWLETTRLAAQTNNTEKAARLKARAAGYEAQLMQMDTPDYKRMQRQLLTQKAAYETLNERRKDTILYDRARDSVQKNVKQLYRWLEKPNEAGHVQTKMEKAVYDLLGKIDPSTSAAGTKSDVRWQETMKDIRYMAEQSLKADKGLADAAEYADFDPDLPDMIGELIDDVGDIDLHKMNGRQTQQLADILTSMKTSILNANKMMAEGRGQAVQTVAENSIRQMQAVKESQLKTRNALIGTAMESHVGDMTAQLLGLDMMDARRYFSSLGEAAENDVYKPIRDGFDKRVWKLDAAQEKFAEIKGKTDIRKWTGSKATKTTFTLSDGSEVALTVGQRMEIYNLTQRQQAHEHLVQGGICVMENGKKQPRVRLTPTDLANITGSLTNEQVRMARQMAEYLSAADGPAGWGNEVSQKLYGLNKFTESYYWPIKTDSNYTRTSDATAGDTPGLYAIKNQGFTKALQRDANNPLIINDAFDTWCDHVANMATYNAWAIPLSDAMKWYNYHGENEISTKEAIDGVYGAKGKKFFQTLMQDINGVSASPSQTGYARLTKAVIRNWKVAKVGANLRVAIQQPTAYTRAAAVISPKYLFAALTYDVGRMKQGMKRAESNCGIAKWKSWGYFETNIGQTMKNVLTGETDTLDKVREISTLGAEWGDKITWGTLWNACELEARDKGMKPGSQESLDYCARRLSEIVDKTQVVDSVLHRSQIMRSKDMLAQMATNFFAEPTKTYSMIAEAMVKLAHGEEGAKANFGRVMATYFVTAFGTAAAAGLIDAMRVGNDDKDKKFGERYKEALWDGFVDNCNLLNNIPMVKDVLSIFDGYDATRTDMEAATDMYDAAVAWQKYLRHDSNSSVTPYKLLYKTANAIADATGIPLGTAVREVKSAYDMVTALQDPLHVDETFTHTAAKMNSRLARGQVDEAQNVLDKVLQDKINSGKTEKEAVSSIRSSLTSKWKPLYLAATDAQRAEIAAKLLTLRANGDVLYTQKDLDKWVEDAEKAKDKEE